MSKINTCDVVKDLMPMYMDGLLSESSRQMMNEHMQTCEKCKKSFTDMGTVIDAGNYDSDKENEEQKALFKGIQKGFRKKYIVRFVIVMLICLVLWVGFECSQLMLKQVERGKDIAYVQKNLEVVQIGDKFYIHQQNFLADADLVQLDVEARKKGVYNFSLVEPAGLQLASGRGWFVHDRYQALTYDGDELGEEMSEQYYDDVPIKQINYCDMKGNVILTLWNEGDEMEHLTNPAR